MILLLACARSYTVGDVHLVVPDNGLVDLYADDVVGFQLAGLSVLSFQEDVESSLGMWNFDRSGESQESFSVKRARASGDGVELDLVGSDGQGGTLAVTADGQHTVFTFRPEAPGAALALDVACHPDGSFHGFGEQYDDVEHSGEEFTLWVSEQGIGRDGSAWQFTGDEHTTYFPMPWYLDKRGFGVLLDTDRRVEASVCVDDTARFEVIGADVLQWRVLHGPEPKDVLDQLGGHVGRPTAPPDWAYGVWMCMQGGQDRVAEQVQTMEDAGIDATVLWVQDWTGRRANPGGGYGVQYRWEPDTDELYPDIQTFFAGLQDRGYRIVGYVNPFVDPALQHWDDLEQGGMLPTHPDTGDTYTFIGPRGQMTTVDLTHPDAQDYILQRLDAAVALGLDGWMADFAEWLPHDAVLHDGDAAQVHNTYPELWQSLSRQALGSDGLYFARSGWTGVHSQAMIHWVGDQEADFHTTDGLPTVVPAMLSLGLSGQPFVSHDIAGFSGGPSTPELYLRWTELGAFTPYMRTHDGNERDDNHRWDTDDETTQHFARFVRVHDALAPELMALAEEAAQTSVPIVRQLGLEYPDDAEAWTLHDQYLLGPDLLVAPMLHQGQDTRDVYLPQGTWFNVWTGEPLDGPGWHTVDGPIGSPPVFSRGQDRTDLRSL